MATLGPLNLIQNQTPADAIPVNQNFQDIQQHVNTELINRDGSIPMTGPLILSDGNPAISSAEGSALVPVGVMMDWPAAAPPAGGDWVLCNGQILTTADYPALQALLGGIYDEPGDSFGGTQFRVPNLNGRSSVGPDGDLEGALANKQGRADVAAPAHTHTGPSHTHTGPSHSHTGPSHSHTTNNHSHTINHGHGDNIAATSSGGSHSHGLNHTHTSSMGTNGSHSHAVDADSGSTFVFRPVDGNYSIRASSGTTHQFRDGPSTLFAASNGGHIHSLTINESGGNTGPSTSHSHTISVSGGVTSHSGSSGNANPSTNLGGTGNTGASGTGATSANGTGDTGSTGDAGPKDNYHPVLVLNKILKAR